MKKYQVKTPRDNYMIEAEDKKEARKIILKKEQIELKEFSKTAKKFKIIDLTSKLPWQKSNGKMDKKTIDTVVVHHDGEHRPAVYNSIARYKKEANYHINKGWGHISYHYIIDNVGDIFRCIPENEVAYHCGNLAINCKSIAVKFDGNFEIQELTKEQIEAYKWLMFLLTRLRTDLPKIIRSSIKGHYQIKATACPGKNVKKILMNF